MPQLGYDNIEDAKSKLVGTHCYYDGKVFTVKNVLSPDLLNPYHYLIQGSFMFNGRAVECNINDPSFNCTEYNLGYANISQGATWFYRLPYKQYKQGLRYDQVASRATNPAYNNASLKASKAIALMLENTYPKLEQSRKLVRDGSELISAFHKNFAISYDDIHNDYIIEYKGQKIGHTHDFSTVNLRKECDHLIESFREVVND
jgi:hypothetical protein